MEVYTCIAILGDARLHGLRATRLQMKLHAMHSLVQSIFPEVTRSMVWGGGKSLHRKSYRLPAARLSIIFFLGNEPLQKKKKKEKN